MYKVLLFSLLAAMPASSNFTLNSYDFGNGGSSATSTNYSLQGSTGDIAGNTTSANFTLPSGISSSTTVGVPAAPTFTNPDSSYNRLKLTLNNSGFATDVKYAIAISDDNFTTTKYVQPDQTIGTSFSVSNYQLYSAWGGASGAWVLGLNQSTTYKVKVAALQGSATGSAFGPTASAATSAPSLTFAVSTSLTSTPPFAVTFASLTPGSVVSADATVTATITTNALNGGSVLLHDQNGGLTSSIAATTISSATTDLTSAGSGYGAQVSNTSQSSGGPIAAVSPYNGASNNVGVLTATWQQLASFASPITTGTATVTLKAKSTTTSPAATDYNDTLTLSLSPLF
jgi:hypothetical protein